MVYSVIPQQINVDDVTIDFNEEEKIQIKGGSISPSLLETGSVVEELILEESVSGNSSKTFTFTNQDTYKRIKVFVQCTGNNGFLTSQVNGLNSGYFYLQKDASNNYESSRPAFNIYFLGAASDLPCAGILDVSVQNGRLVMNAESCSASFAAISGFTGGNTSTVNHINSLTLNRNSSSTFTYYIKIVGYRN